MSFRLRVTMLGLALASPTLPGPALAQARLAFDNGDFEGASLSAWRTATGPAPAQLRVCHQPTTVQSETLRIAGGPPAALGGDYWHVPFATSEARGEQGSCWLKTTKRLTSAPFVATQPYVLLLARGAGAIQLRSGTGAVLATKAVGEGPSMQVVALHVPGQRGRRVRVAVVPGDRAVEVDMIQLADTPADAAPAGDGGRVWGFADVHVHPTAHLGMGGLKGRQVLWGVPGGAYRDYQRDPGLIDRDIPQCDGWAHDNQPKADLSDLTQLTRAAVLRGMEAGLPPDAKRDAAVLGTQPGKYVIHDKGYAGSKRGLEAFKGLHQQHHITQIRRSYEGGLRLMSALINHNQQLEMLMSPDRDGRAEGGMTPEIDLIRAHACATRALARLNADWMEIALTPEDAERIIRSNKLAVVLGVEVPDLGRLGVGSPDDEVEALHALGIRQVTVLHGADNALGGSAIFQDVYNTLTDLLNRPSELRDAFRDKVDRHTYRFFDVRDASCPGLPRGECVLYQLRKPERMAYRYQFPVGNMAAPYEVDGQGTSYPGVRGQVNAQGLTAAGRRYIQALMARGMIVDIAHMSERSIADTLAITRAPAARAHGGRCGGDWAQPPAGPHTTTTARRALSAPADCYDDAYPLLFSHVAFRALSLHVDGTPLPSGTEPRSPTGTIIRDNLPREFELSDTNAEIIRRSGGVIGLFIGHDPNEWPAENTGVQRPTTPNDCGLSTEGFALELQYANLKLGGRGIALGTDATFHPMHGPRFGERACAFHELAAKWDERDGPKEDREEMRRLRAYPGQGGPIDFYRPDEQRNAVNYGTLSRAQPATARRVAEHPELKPFRIGGKVYDYNVEGWANYGMIPDTLQDAKNLGVRPGDLAPLFRSAADYMEMWRKARRVGGCGATGCAPRTVALDCVAACRGRCPDSPNAGAPPPAADWQYAGPFTHDATEDARRGVCQAQTLPATNEWSPKDECQRNNGPCLVDQSCHHRANVCSGVLGARTWARCEDDPDRPPLGDAFHGPPVRLGACYAAKRKPCSQASFGSASDTKLAQQTCEEVAKVLDAQCTTGPGSGGVLGHPRWDRFENKGCEGANRLYSSRILDPGLMSWEHACQNTPATIADRANLRPTRCIRSIFGMWGEFLVPDAGCAATGRPYWDVFEDKGCEGANRLFSSRIKNTQQMSWEQACQTTPATIAGRANLRANRCVKSIIGMWGEFLVPDTRCR
jgi:microsomal dipeptidase-like Zn-dependent dipeptidase